MPLSILPFFDKCSVDKKPKPTNNNTNPSAEINQKSSDMSLNDCLINGNYRFIKKIGAGTYGLIYLVEDVQRNKVYAAKLILKRQPKDKNGCKIQDVNESKRYIQQQLYDYFHDMSTFSPLDITASELDLQFLQNECKDCPFLREIALHLAVHEHQNVISIHKVFNLDKMGVVILMDYFPQGDLFNNIIEKQIFVNPPNTDGQLLMKNAILQLIDVLLYCTSKGIYHCDLKPENIMVNYNPNYKRPDGFTEIIDHNEIHIALIDFGLAMNNPLVCCNVCRGSSFYMAPERITNYTSSLLIKSMVDLTRYKSVDLCNSQNCTMNRYFPTLAGDIWSLAVLLINIVCSRNPWPIAQIDAVHENQVFHNYIFGNHSLLREILPISKQFNRLLDKIFVMDPASRLPLESIREEIITIDFFKDYLDKPTTTTYTTEESSEEVSLFSPKNAGSSNSSFWVSNVNSIEVKPTPIY